MSGRTKVLRVRLFETEVAKAHKHHKKVGTSLVLYISNTSQDKVL